MDGETLENNRIDFLSEPAPFSMADEWFDMAKPDHFWFKWRFNALRKILPRDFIWGRCLEIGCGNATVIKQIEDFYGCPVSGCDLNLSALKKSPQVNGNLFFYNINQRQAEFKERFNTIILFDVLEHIKDIKYFLASVSFHLKENGQLIINVPALESCYSKYDQVAGHFRRYSLSLLKKELSLSAFEITGYSYWGLSMIPLLFIRKMMLNFYSRDYVIEKGFLPSNPLINFVLESMCLIECAIFKKVPIGTSLMAIAKKE
ncbi:MAG: class I SAM-dependent methyltransferase [Candidatus Omnitrophica bacterium]|nr:class I SAM-dependent methyltransferase [Candidatus Omnitrophota bacterium]